MKKIVRVKSLLCISILLLVFANGCGNSEDAVQDSEETAVIEEEESSVAEATIHEHTWVEATCTQPRTCSVCGATEGEPLEHEWTYATLEAPKTCVNCGATEGNPIVCKQLNIESTIGSGWDRWVPYPDSIIAGKRLSDSSIQIAFFDYDGNKLTDYSLEFGNDSWGYSILSPFDEDSCTIAVQTATLKENGDISIVLYDQMGNKIKEHNFNYDISSDDYVSLTTCVDHNYVAIIQKPSNTVIKYIDTKDLSLVEKDQVNTTLINDVEVTFDETKFSECYKQFATCSSGYLVSSADGTKWGYVDDDFNEIAMYADATDFTLFGYAIVSEDGKNYDIIDKDFNVIAKDYIQGNGAYLAGYTDSGAMLTLLTDDGDVNLYIR